MPQKLISLSEVDDLTPRQVRSYYNKYSNSGFPKFLSILGYDKVNPHTAEGMVITDKNGTEIHDYTGGMSVLNLGHNHPKVTRAKQEFEAKQQPEVWKHFPNPYAAELSEKLAAICPGDLNHSFYFNSGAEANEGALKLAQKFQGPEKQTFIYTDISFHGKTHATLSLTGNEGDKRKYFTQLPGCVSIPYGDIEAFEKVISSRTESDGNDICAFILEALVAEEMVLPPEGYFKKVRELCDQHNIVLIIDEVYNGMGRTGKMFAFEHEGIVPDIFTIAKSLAGGKATLAACIARDHIFDGLKINDDEAFLFTTSFSGLAEECVCAIETLKVFEEEKLVENATEMGAYFLEQLKNLQNRFPRFIKAVNGRGLLIAVEFHLPFEKLVMLMSKASGFFKEFAEGFLTGVVMSQFLDKHRILILPGAENKSSIFINPSLIITREDVDFFITAFEKLLRRGKVGLAFDFVGMKVRGLFG